MESTIKEWAGNFPEDSKNSPLSRPAMRGRRLVTSSAMERTVLLHRDRPRVQVWHRLSTQPHTHTHTHTYGRANYDLNYRWSLQGWETLSSSERYTHPGATTKKRSGRNVSKDDVKFAQCITVQWVKSYKLWEENWQKKIVKVKSIKSLHVSFFKVIFSQFLISVFTYPIHLHVPMIK